MCTMRTKNKNKQKYGIQCHRSFILQIFAYTTDSIKIRRQINLKLKLRLETGKTKHKIGRISQ